MRTLRQKQQIDVTDDPVTGQERVLDESVEIDVLGDQGSVDTVSRHKRIFRDCGCDGPPGGQCSECGAISCPRCHGHCGRCGKPICLEHSVVVGAPDEQGPRLCRRCDVAIRRRRRLASFGRSALSPFVRFKD